MPRKPARLSNTYVPLPAKKKILTDNKAASSSSSQQQQQQQQPIRTDRRHEELRPLCMETSILSEPTVRDEEGTGKKYKCLGSSLVELGHTKVLCEVNAIPTSIVDQGSLQCQVQFAKQMGRNAILQRLHMSSPLESTMGGGGGGSSGASALAGEAFSVGKLQNATSQLEADLAQEVTVALNPILQDHMFRIPKCAIQLLLTVLQDDGSVLSTCIGAATLALMDAQVEMTDLVTSCTVAAIATGGDDDDGDECIFLADPTQEEMIQAQAIICLAMTPNHKEVTLWRQSGRLTSDIANQAIELCRSGCRTMHKFMRETWVVTPNSNA